MPQDVKTITLPEALFDFAHPWAQPFGRPSFGIRPIRLSLPNCGCGPLAALWYNPFFNNVCKEYVPGVKITFSASAKNF
jgi:hypothetical protein